MRRLFRARPRACAPSTTAMSSRAAAEHRFVAVLATACLATLAACANVEPVTGGPDRGGRDTGGGLGPDRPERRDSGLGPDDSGGVPEPDTSDTSAPGDASSPDVARDTSLGDTTEPDGSDPPDTVGPGPDTGPRPDGGEDCAGGACACTPANAATVCGGRACVDGYCCDEACTGTCRSCAVAGSEGTCTNVPAGEDLRDDCAPEAPSTCGRNGLCDGAGRCALHPSGTLCDDGQACSSNDRCDGAGLCTGDVPETCGPGAGNVCCVGTCIDGSGCRTVASTCADQCTAKILRTGSTCTGCGLPGAVGTCTEPTEHVCDESTGGLCREATCGGTSWRCTNVGGVWEWRASAACDDGNACTHSDVCDGSGICRGTSVTCTSTACMDASCNGTATCTQTPRPGAACSDGNACTANDVCSAAGICQPGPLRPCESSACIDRQCDGTGGCIETVRTGAVCDDGDPCTHGDVCSASGVCERGTPITCTGLDTTCATFACNGTSTCARTARNVGQVCDDGNPATDFDVCRADGTCVGDSGCPPPAAACVAGTQNRRGCGGARVVSRLAAGNASGFLISDTTCSGASNDFDDSSGCWDANRDHSYRIYLRQGEQLRLQYNTQVMCGTSSTRWNATLKIFETAGCDSLTCGAKVHCVYNRRDHDHTYTAPRDGWVIVVADGSHASDDRGSYRLTFSLQCRGGNCGCLP